MLRARVAALALSNTDCNLRRLHSLRPREPLYAPPYTFSTISLPTSYASCVDSGCARSCDAFCQCSVWLSRELSSDVPLFLDISPLHSAAPPIRRVPQPPAGFVSQSAKRRATVFCRWMPRDLPFDPPLVKQR